MLENNNNFNLDYYYYSFEFSCKKCATKTVQMKKCSLCNLILQLCDECNSNLICSNCEKIDIYLPDDEFDAYDNFLSNVSIADKLFLKMKHCNIM